MDEEVAVSVMLQFDAETARRVEAVYTTPDVVAQRREVLRILGSRPGEHVVDIGAAPGFLAAEMAQQVGPRGRVHAVDPSESMLALARSRQDPSAAPVEVVAGSAEALPVPDASVEVAVATQVFEYVADIPGALAEVRRVLRPGGRALLLDTDWDSIVWHTRDAARTEQVLAAWEEHLADPHLPRTLRTSLRAAGFLPAQPVVLPLFNVGADRNTYSAGLVPIIAAFVPGRSGVTDADTAAWLDDLASLGDEWFFSLNRYVFLATTPG
jgi:ubiquinone/menaquinone biosynthesis C-methylase UbiE